MRRFSSLLLVPLAAILWALGSELAAPRRSTAELQRVYTAEQDKIDLALAELALEASSGQTDPGVVQHKIDQWVRANAGRLQEQAERASELDTLLPMPPVLPSEAVEQALKSPEERSIAELDALQEQRVQKLRGQATSPEHLQQLIDAWAIGAEGTAVFAKRGALYSKVLRDYPLGSEPIVLEVSQTATPPEVASLDAQERIARRIQDIRSRHPKADGELMQRLIDEARDDFDRDIAEVGDLMKQARHAELSAAVEKLRQRVSAASAAAPRSQ